MIRKVTFTPQASGIAEQVEMASRVLRQFRIVFNSVKGHFQQAEKITGVGGAQVWALSLIRAEPGIGVSSLARAMDVRQPTASNLVRALAEQGYVEVRKDSHDRRAVRLYLLRNGKRLLSKAPTPLAGVLPNALAKLDARSLKRLEIDMAKLIDALAAERQAGDIPIGMM